jgi:DNA-directed RNA polymerase specialized sigma24 family protein
MLATDACRRYAGYTFGLARRLLGDEADVEQVVRQVLVRLVYELDTSPREADLIAWLRRATVNAVIAHRRKDFLQDQADEAALLYDFSAGPGPGGTPIRTHTRRLP